MVEDHPLQRRMLVRLIESMGVANVLEAENGIQALAYVRDASLAIDLVFTDLDMPVMDGLALMRLISEQVPNAGVVVLSSVEHELLTAVQWLAREQDINLVSIISKPASRQAIENALHHPTRRATMITTPFPQLSIEEIAAGLEGNQFEAFVQPKVRFTDGSLVGAEALARWHHPQRGWITPSAFIERIEASPLIEPFSLAILESVAWAMHWLDATGLPGRIALNASATWLDQSTMAERLLQALQRLGLPTTRLTVEVTESVANTNLSAALENLARLRMAGVALSVDDFGTGFSSLQRLVSSPFSELKLDRSFVSGIERDSPRWHVVEATIALAKKLGLKTVAEGVETDAEWDLLKDIGCDICQGYFSAKPMCSADFFAWAQQRHHARPFEVANGSFVSQLKVST